MNPMSMALANGFDGLANTLVRITVAGGFLPSDVIDAFKVTFDNNLVGANLMPIPLNNGMAIDSDAKTG